MTNKASCGITPAIQMERQGMAYPESDIRSVLPDNAPYMDTDHSHSTFMDRVKAGQAPHLMTKPSRFSPVAFDEYQAAQRNAVAAAQQQADVMQRNAEHQRANVFELRPGQERTEEQILDECQARYEEMQREAAKPENQFPCSTCAWKARGYRNGCRQPLITGLGGTVVDNWDASHTAARRATSLCGPEKALWEPRKLWWQRLMDWIVSWLG